MYLVHGTSLQNLYLILKEGVMKSNRLSGKVRNGFGYQGPHDFIYFHLERKLFADTVFYNIKLYFNPDLLSDRNFYVSTIESPVIEKDFDSKWTDQGYKEFKKKHKKNTQNIPKILDKFYFHHGYTFLHGNIAIKNKFDISDYLVGVEIILYDKPNDKLIAKIDKIKNLLNKKYPNVTMKNKIVKDKEYLIKNAVRVATSCTKVDIS